MGLAHDRRTAVLARLTQSSDAFAEPRDWVRWLLEEMRFERRQAQAIAEGAYARWHDLRTGEAYAVYRAAQDRADAAQDELAAFVAQHAEPTA